MSPLVKTVIHGRSRLRRGNRRVNPAQELAHTWAADPAPRYTHWVAISNRRLLAFDEAGVTFRYKDYRRDGAERYRTMTLTRGEFIRRFMLHVLPKGFHRIRHYGLLASAGRRANVARARALFAVPPVVEPAEPVEPKEPQPPCPCCGGRMIIVETFQRWMQPRAPPFPA